MNKTTRNTTKWVTVLGLFVILCGVWALAPLWLNPCISTHLNEEEIKQFREQYGSKYITPEEQAKNDQRRREEEIPCGAQDLPTFEKLEASRFQGMILGELRGFRPVLQRVELVGTSDPPGTYYFKGYTFFFIPIFEALGGGSGYMEIVPYPFLYRCDGPGPIRNKWFCMKEN
jgi:hypothetical protein